MRGEWIMLLWWWLLEDERVVIIWGGRGVDDVIMGWEVEEIILG